MSYTEIAAIIGGVIVLAILGGFVALGHCVHNSTGKGYDHAQRMFERARLLRILIPILVVLFLLDMVALLVVSKDLIAPADQPFSPGLNIE